MEENPYRTPAHDNAANAPLGGCLEAARQFGVGLLIAVVLIAIGVAFCVGIYHTTSFFSAD
jgi:hypothetical protein